MFALTRRDWQGAENLPATGGFLACSNHISYADPIVLAHYLFDNGKPPHFLGKNELFQVPGIGAILKGAEQIPVFRETGQAADAFRAAVAAVDSGQCIAIYPEGTLTRDPDIWPMTGKTGAAKIALTTKCPVIPIGQWGAQAMLAPYAKVPHLVPRPTVQVTAGPPVDLSDLYDQPMDRVVLKVATNRILDAITRIVSHLRGEPAPVDRFDARAHGFKATGNFKKKGRGR
jgi:1-acyl-sn-glycerol-3-phosphate acyltransferase